MPAALPEDLEAFLRKQDAGALMTVLLELAGAHDAVRQRLLRMQMAERPDKLAASFRKTLSAWRRSSKYYGYSEAREFGLRLEGWLDQVARELLPKDPPAALALFESFIEADKVWFECADDSDGVVGDAMRAACQHWLRAAARCETSLDVWPERLLRLARADDYGGREDLLRRAGLLLAEPAMRELVARFEAEMSLAVRAASGNGRRSSDTYSISAGLSLLAEALGDPDVQVRAVLSYRPNPNPMQQEVFVRAYLDAGRPADALAWLDKPWEHMENSRQSLLAQALGRLGRFAESAPIRQRIFERTLSPFDLRQWLEHLPEPARPDALARARTLAIEHDDPVVAATLLLELGDAAAAEAILIGKPERIDGSNYPGLVPMARALRAGECFRAETVIYRALLKNILERAYARAYSHAAHYWSRLREIADSGTDLMPLAPHTEFEAEIRLRHARKPAFWAHVNGKRRDESDHDSGLPP